MRTRVRGPVTPRTRPSVRTWWSGPGMYNTLRPPRISTGKYISHKYLDNSHQLKWTKSEADSYQTMSWKVKCDFLKRKIRNKASYGMFGLYRVLSIYTIKILDGILKKPIL